MNDLTLVTVSNDPRQLGSLLEWARRLDEFKEIIVVVDAHAAAVDETEEVAKRLADRVFCWPVIGYQESVWYASDEQVRTEWMIRLDGDERLGERCHEALAQACASAMHWFRQPRYALWPDSEHYIANAPWYPDHQIRLCRPGHVRAWWGVVGQILPVKGVGGVMNAHQFHYKAIAVPLEARKEQARRYHALGVGRWSDYGLLPEKYASVCQFDLRECEEKVIP